MLYATTTSDVVVVLQYVTPYICTGACMYSITLQVCTSLEWRKATLVRRSDRSVVVDSGVASAIIYKSTHRANVHTSTMI